MMSTLTIEQAPHQASLQDKPGRKTEDALETESETEQEAELETDTEPETNSEIEPRDGVSLEMVTESRSAPAEATTIVVDEPAGARLPT